jgi:hypothetical protein
MNNLLNDIENEPKIYTLMSVGTRGVGKTVFLVSCYQELLKHSLRLKCEDEESEKNIQKILDYISRTGQYPPATLKIGNFDFRVQRREGERERTVGIVRWWDVPGESCQLYNLAFLTMMLHADGCLLFIEAGSLAGEDTKNPVPLNTFKTILELVSHNKPEFAVGVVITKCDRIPDDSDERARLQNIVRKLDEDLKTSAVNRELFFSGVVIDPDTRTLRSDRAESFSRWLLSRVLDKKDTAQNEPVQETPDFQAGASSDLVNSEGLALSGKQDSTPDPSL